MKNLKKRILSAIVATAMIFTSFTFTAIAEETQIAKIYADSFGIEVVYSSIPEESEYSNIEITSKIDGSAVDFTTEFTEETKTLRIDFGEEIVLDEMYYVTIGNVKKKITVNTVVDENFENFTFEGNGSTDFTAYQKPDPDSLTPIWSSALGGKVQVLANAAITQRADFGAEPNNKKLLLTNNSSILTVAAAGVGLDATVSAVINPYLNGSNYWGNFGPAQMNTGSGDWGYTSIFNAVSLNINYVAPRYVNYYLDPDDLDGDKKTQDNESATGAKTTSTGSYYHGLIGREKAVNDSGAGTGYTTYSGTEWAYPYTKNADGEDITITQPTVKDHHTVMRAYASGNTKYNDQDVADVVTMLYANEGETPAYISTLINNEEHNTLTNGGRVGIQSAPKAVLIVDDLLITTCTVEDNYPDADILNENIYVDQYGVDIRVETPASDNQKENVTVTALDGTGVEVTTEYDKENDIIHVHFTEAIDLETMYVLDINGTKKYIRVVKEFEENFESADLTGKTTATDGSFETKTAFEYKTDGILFAVGGKVFVTNDPNLNAASDDQKLVLFDTDSKYYVSYSNTKTIPWKDKDVTFSMETQTYCTNPASTNNAIQYARTVFDGRAAAKSMGFSVGPTQSKLSMTTNGVDELAPVIGVSKGWQKWNFPYSDKNSYGDVVTTATTATTGSFTSFDKTTGTYAVNKKATKLTHAVRTIGNQFSGYAGSYGNMAFAHTLTEPSEVDLSYRGMFGADIGDTDTMMVIDNIVITSSEVSNYVSDAEFTNEDIYADNYGIEIRLETPASLEQIQNVTVEDMSGNDVEVTAEYDSNEKILNIHFVNTIEIGKRYKMNVNGVEKLIKVNKEFEEDFNSAAFTGITTATENGTTKDYTSLKETFPVVASNGTKWTFSGSSFITNDVNLDASPEDQKLVLFHRGNYPAEPKSTTVRTEVGAWKDKKVTYSADTQIYSLNENAFDLAFMFVDSHSVPNSSAGFSIGPNKSKLSKTWYANAEDKTYDTKEWAQYAFSYKSGVKGDIIENDATMGELLDFNTEDGTFKGVTTKATTVKHAIRAFDGEYSGYAGTAGDMAFAHTIKPPIKSKNQGMLGFGLPNTTNAMLVVDNILVTSSEVSDNIADAEIQTIYADIYGVDVVFDDTPSYSQQEVRVTTTRDEEVKATRVFDEDKNIVHVIFDEEITLDKYYKLVIGSEVKYFKVNTVVEEDFDNQQAGTEPSTAAVAIADGKLNLSADTVITTDTRFGANATNKKLVLTKAKAGVYTLPAASIGTEATITADVATYRNGKDTPVTYFFKRINGVNRPTAAYSPTDAKFGKEDTPQQYASLTEEPTTKWTTGIGPDVGAGNKLSIEKGSISVGNAVSSNYVIQDYWTYTNYRFLYEQAVKNAEDATDEAVAAQWTERAAYYAELRDSTSVGSEVISLAKDTSNNPYRGMITTNDTAIDYPYTGATITAPAAGNIKAALRTYDLTGTNTASDAMAGFVGLNGESMQYGGTTVDIRRAVDNTGDNASKGRLGVEAGTTGVTVVDNLLITTCTIEDNLTTTENAEIESIYVDLYGVDLRLDGEASLDQKENASVKDVNGNEVKISVQFDENKNILHLHFDEKIELNKVYTIEVDGYEKMVKVVKEYEANFNDADFTTATVPEGKTEPTFETCKAVSYTSNGVTWSATAKTYVFSTDDPSFGATPTDKKIVLFGGDTSFATDGTVPWSGKDVTYSAETQTYTMDTSSIVSYAYVNIDNHRVASGKAKAFSIGDKQSKLSMTAGETKKADGTSFNPITGQQYSGWQAYGFTYKDDKAYGDIVPTVSSGTSGAFTDFDSTTAKYTTAPTKATTLTHAIRKVGNQFSGYAGVAGELAFARTLTVPTELAPSASDSGRIAAGVSNAGTILVIDNVLVTSFVEVENAETATIKGVYADTFGVDVRLNGPASIAQQTNSKVTDLKGNVIKTTTQYDANANIITLHFNEAIEYGKVYVVDVDGEKRNVRVVKEFEENFNSADLTGKTTATDGDFTTKTKFPFTNNGVTWSADGKAYITNSADFGATAADQKLVLFDSAARFGTGSASNLPWKDKDVTISAETQTYSIDTSDNSMSYAYVYIDGHGVPYKAKAMSIGPKQSKLSMTTSRYRAEDGSSLLPTSGVSYSGWQDYGFNYKDTSAYGDIVETSAATTIGTFTEFNATTGAYTLNTKATPLTHAVRTVGNQFSGYAGVAGNLKFARTLTVPDVLAPTYSGTFGAAVESADTMLVVDNILITSSEELDDVADAQIANIYADLYGLDVVFESAPSFTQLEATFTTTRGEKVKAKTEFDSENNILHFIFDEQIKLNKNYLLTVGDVEKYVKVTKALEEDFESYEVNSELSTSTKNLQDGKLYLGKGTAIINDARFGEGKKLVIAGGGAEGGIYTHAAAQIGTDVTISAKINKYDNYDATAGAQTTFVNLYKKLNEVSIPADAGSQWSTSNLPTPDLENLPEHIIDTTPSVQLHSGNRLNITSGKIELGMNVNTFWNPLEYYGYSYYNLLSKAATKKAEEATAAGNTELADKWTARAAEYTELQKTYAVGSKVVKLAEDTANNPYTGKIGDNTAKVEYPYTTATITAPAKAVNVALRNYDSTGTGAASDVMAGIVGLGNGAMEYRGTTIDQRKAVVGDNKGRLGIETDAYSVVVVDDIVITTCAVVDVDDMTTEIYTVKDIWADLEGIYVEFDKPLVDDDDFSQITLVENKRDKDFDVTVDEELITIVPKGGMNVNGLVYTLTIPEKFEPREFALTDKAYSESFSVTEIVNEDFSGSGIDEDKIMVMYDDSPNDITELPTAKAEISNGAYLLRDATLALPGVSSYNDYIVEFDATVYTSVLNRTWEDEAFNSSYYDAVPNINMWYNSGNFTGCEGGYLWNIKNATVQKKYLTKEGIQTSFETVDSTPISFGDAYYLFEENGFTVVESGESFDPDNTLAWNTEIMADIPDRSTHQAAKYPVRVEKNSKAAKYFLDNKLQSEFIGNEEDVHENGIFGIDVSGTEYVVIDNLVAYSYTEIDEITVAVDESNVTVTNITAVEKPVVIVVAAYDANNRMIDAWVSDTKTIKAEDTISKEFDLQTNGAAKIKAFVWDNMTNLMPYCAPEETPVTPAQ